jgi:hypothetical protein
MSQIAIRRAIAAAAMLIAVFGFSFATSTTATAERPGVAVVHADGPAPLNTIWG